jgi:hypothetical protein
MSPLRTFGAANPITKITVGTLEEIDYTVDYTKAKDLTIYFLEQDSMLCYEKKRLRDKSVHHVGYIPENGKI